MSLHDCTGFNIAAALVAEIAAECGRRDEAEAERRREYMDAHPPQHMWGDGGYAGLCAND
jgi:hypothetical protein